MNIALKKGASILLVFSLVIVLIFSFSSKVIGSTNDGLAAHYKFDDNALDSSTNGNNGTAIGGLTYVSGVNGNAAQFDGSSYIEVPDSSSLDLQKNFTISVWVYKNTDSSDNTTPILVKTEDAIIHQKPYILYDRLLKPNLELGIPTGSKRFEATNPVDMHGWEMITYTYDGQEVKYFINGKLTDTKLYTNDLNVSTGKLLIGKMDLSGKTWFYDGFMDDLRIYNKTLTYDDVKSLYTDIVNGTGKDIVIKPNQQMAYFKFNGNLNDSSANKNNASVIGNEKYEYAVQGKGFVFDSETYIEVPDSDSLEATSGLTLSAWIKVNTINTTWTEWPILDRPKSSITSGASAYTYYARVFGGGKSGQIAFYLLNKATSPLGVLSKNIDSRISKWCMLTVAFNDSDKTVTCYVNGTQTDAIRKDDFTLRHSGGKLIIGLMNNSRFFKGTMDEVRLYNYQMKSADVKKLYAYRDTLKVSNSTSSLSSLKVRGRLSLKVLAVPPDRTEESLNVTQAVKYSSSNQRVVKVSTKGVVSAIKKGSATITITNGASTTTAKIKVK